MRFDAELVEFDAGGDVVVTSDFLYRVHRNLSSLAAKLERQEAAARTLLRFARDEVGNADGSWRGPRSRKVVGSASGYLDAIDPYPGAVDSARQTILRWANAAFDTADRLAWHECAVDPTDELRCGTVVGLDQPCYAVGPDVAIEEIRAAWARTCIAFGEELVPATVTISKANAAIAEPITADDAPALRAQLALVNLQDPALVRVWWNRLTDGEQLALLTAYPGLLHGVAGLPARVRVMARRTQLLDQLTLLEVRRADGTLTLAERQRLHQIRSELRQPDPDDGPPPHAGGDPDVELIPLNEPDFGGPTVVVAARPAGLAGRPVRA